MLDRMVHLCHSSAGSQGLREGSPFQTTAAGTNGAQLGAMGLGFKNRQMRPQGQDPQLPLGLRAGEAPQERLRGSVLLGPRLKWCLFDVRPCGRHSSS